MQVTSNKAKSEQEVELKGAYDLWHECRSMYQIVQINNAQEKREVKINVI